MSILKWWDHGLNNNTVCNKETRLQQIITKHLINQPLHMCSNRFLARCQIYLLVQTKFLTGCQKHRCCYLYTLKKLKFLAGCQKTHRCCHLYTLMESKSLAGCQKKHRCCHLYTLKALDFLAGCQKKPTSAAISTNGIKFLLSYTTKTLQIAT